MCQTVLWCCHCALGEGWCGLCTWKRPRVVRSFLRSYCLVVVPVSRRLYAAGHPQVRLQAPGKGRGRADSVVVVYWWSSRSALGPGRQGCVCWVVVPVSVVWEARRQVGRLYQVRWWCAVVRWRWEAAARESRRGGSRHLLQQWSFQRGSLWGGSVV